MYTKYICIQEHTVVMTLKCHDCLLLVDIRAMMTSYVSTLFRDYVYIYIYIFAFALCCFSLTHPKNGYDIR